MDYSLLEAVRPHINEDMDWNDLIAKCEIYDSVRRYKKGSSNNPARNQQHSRLQSKPFIPTNSNSNSKPAPRFDRNNRPRKPAPKDRRFVKLTPEEQADLACKGGCFWCRKIGHQLKDCPERKQKLSSAAGIINKDTLPEITSAAQSINEKAVSPPTKGLGTNPVLDTSKDHLLVTTKVEGQIVKTLVDQQTAGADLISSKFYTIHKIPLHPLKPPVTLQITMKGS